MLGAILYFPARYWSKRLSAGASETNPKIRLTRVGHVFVWTTVLLLIGGLLADYLLPTSWLGRFVETAYGRFSYLAFLIVAARLVEILLKRGGIRIIQKDDRIRGDP